MFILINSFKIMFQFKAKHRQLVGWLKVRILNLVNVLDHNFSEIKIPSHPLL